MGFCQSKQIHLVHLEMNQVNSVQMSSGRSSDVWPRMLMLFSSPIAVMPMVPCATFVVKSLTLRLTDKHRFGVHYVEGFRWVCLWRTCNLGSWDCVSVGDTWLSVQEDIQFWIYTTAFSLNIFLIGNIHIPFLKVLATTAKFLVKPLFRIVRRHSMSTLQAYNVLIKTETLRET